MICDKFINIIFYVEIISQFIYSVITITLISIHKNENCTTQFELNFIQYFYISIISILCFFLWIINITNIVITMDDFKKVICICYKFITFYFIFISISYINEKKI